MERPRKDPYHRAPVCLGPSSHWVGWGGGGPAAWRGPWWKALRLGEGSPRSGESRGWHRKWERERVGRERLQHSLPGPVKLHLAGPSSPQNPLKLPPTSRPWQTISSHSVAAAPGRTLVAAAWTRVSQGNERLHLPLPGAGPATQGPGALGVRLPPARVDRHSRREVNQVATVCCRRACRDPAVRGQVSRPGGHPTRVLQSVHWGNTYRSRGPTCSLALGSSAPRRRRFTCRLWPCSPAPTTLVQ